MGPLTPLRVLKSMSPLINLIFCKLAGYNRMHKILDEFEFWTDPVTYSGVSYPRVPEKYHIDLYLESDVNLPFLIESSIKLLVTREGV